jgi:NADPH:quinone reductase-like Zn-dependent oxidoreductase
MKAVVYKKYGAPSVLHLAEVEKPRIRPNEILVKVHASTVTSGTLWVRQGDFPGSAVYTFFIRLLYGIRKPRRPILGYEFSGVVADVGSQVTRFKKGDAVYGTTTGLKQGAYAEYVCIPETWKQGVMAQKPETLSFEAAAALPIGGMTALQLLQKAGVQKNDTVFIYGASGSVGTYAVQLASYFGGVVTAACSGANMPLVTSIGAVEVLDYSVTNFKQLPTRFDVVFDAVGKLPKAIGKQLLKPGGRFISVKSMTKEKTEYLDVLEAAIAAGALRPVIDRVYPLAETADAHAYADLGHKKGNVVIAVER